MQNIIQCYVIADEKFLCTQAGEIKLFTEDELRDLPIDSSSRFLLKQDNGYELYVVSISLAEITGFQWLGLRHFLESISESEFQTAGRALQILRWHFDHQFCGRCGKPTVQHTHDLAKKCITCGIDFYPRLSPCIITLITRGDECLLAWHTRSKAEKYSCLAGFIEVGESAEQTLTREVMEEVGLKVKNIRYVESQPWPFPGQLMFGYIVDYDDGEIVIDHNEIRAAHWFRFDQLPVIPPVTTISGRLIDTFVQARKNDNLTV